MFKEDEGLSTLLLAQSIKAARRGGRLISIEYDKTHVDAAQRILERREPDLLDVVEFRVGHSLALLPAALDELGSIDLASLDGGAHPEVCLQEFELVSTRLSSEGLILVDDLQELRPSAAYSLPRPLGKGTLILPMLLIKQYLDHRAEFTDANAAPDGPSTKPASRWLASLESSVTAWPSPAPFAVLGRQQKMLAYGAHDPLQAVIQASNAYHQSSWLRRAADRLLLRRAE